MPSDPPQPPTTDDLAVDAVKQSALGRAAILVQKLTGLPPLACVVIVLAFGAYTGVLQQYLPSGKQLKAQAATERAENAVRATENERQIAFLHAKLNETSTVAIKARDDAADARAELRDAQARVHALEATVAYLRGVHRQ